MKYLIDLFVPYGSFNILLVSMSSIFITFLFLQKSLFLTYYRFYVLSTNSYTWRNKKDFFFCDDLGV